MTRNITTLLLALSRSLRIRAFAPAPARQFCNDCSDVRRCVDLGVCYRSYAAPVDYS